MIACLKGVLLEKSLQRVVVDVGGVGYLVSVSMQTLAELPAVGESVRLLCHTHVREDAIQIFGFLRAEEQQAFELLLLVSGIGPKLALTILSGMSVRDLLQAIADGDCRRLQGIPGVGKKTAERLVVELRDRCAKLTLPAATGQGGGLGTAGAGVIEALVGLGYKRALAERALEQVLKQRADLASAGPEQLLRAALASVVEQ